MDVITDMDMDVDVDVDMDMIKDMDIKDMDMRVRNRKMRDSVAHLVRDNELSHLLLLGVKLC